MTHPLPLGVMDAQARRALKFWRGLARRDARQVRICMDQARRARELAALLARHPHDAAYWRDAVRVWIKQARDWNRMLREDRAEIAKALGGRFHA